MNAQHQFKALNEITGQTELVTERQIKRLPDGTQVWKFYRSFDRKGDPQWCTVPGASLYYVENGSLKLDAE